MPDAKQEQPLWKKNVVAGIVGVAVALFVMYGCTVKATVKVTPITPTSTTETGR